GGCVFWQVTSGGLRWRCNEPPATNPAHAQWAKRAAAPALARRPRYWGQADRQVTRKDARIPPTCQHVSRACPPGGRGPPLSFQRHGPSEQGQLRQLQTPVESG